MSVRFDGQDHLTASEVMAMLGRALREGWDVSLHQKKRAVVLLERIALNKEASYSIRQQFRAIRLLMQMEASNRRVDLETARRSLEFEKANRLASLESLMNGSFAECGQDSAREDVR